MQRASFKLFNPRDGRQVGTAIFFGKSLKAAQEAGKRYFRKMNVAAGFTDASGFHPIRASFDYDPRQAGERSASFGRKRVITSASQRRYLKSSKRKRRR